MAQCAATGEEQGRLIAKVQNHNKMSQIECNVSGIRTQLAVIVRVHKAGALIGKLNLFISASSVSSPMCFFGGHEIGSEHGQN